MKTILTTLALVLTLGTFAQEHKLAIGKLSVDGDALVDFGTELRGMVIAPITNVSTMSPAPSAGTIAFDGATGSFRYYNGTAWSAARPGGDTSGADVAAGTDTYQQLIGTETSSATGVVIMGADTGEDQAFVLPKLENGNLKFNNPVTGLMYYDTALKAVMVYNGNGWTSY
jgi:hypothetical protein